MFLSSRAHPTAMPGEANPISDDVSKPAPAGTGWGLFFHLQKPFLAVLPRHGWGLHQGEFFLAAGVMSGGSVSPHGLCLSEAEVPVGGLGQPPFPLIFAGAAGAGGTARVLVSCHGSLTSWSMQQALALLSPW